MLDGSPRINHVDILNPILEQESDDDKLAILEVNCRSIVLEMIAKSPLEREMYEARLKFERDQIWRIKAGCLNHR